MAYEPFDRVPVWFFGTWHETRLRWKAEEGIEGIDVPAFLGMDPDWEEGMWEVQGLVNHDPLAEARSVTLEETDTYRIVRGPLGDVKQHSKIGSSIPHTLEYALKPTAESWARYKTFLDPENPRRYPDGWQTKAQAFNLRDRVATFMAGSLYGWPREWMGVEELSYLTYDNPALLDEILEHLTDFFIALHRPVLAQASFDFAYFFEDCCFNTGPLLSPDIYRKHYDKHYRRLIAFYREMGVPFVLIDSDGKTDDLIPCWMESGFDIFFPIEVGTWNADPVELRRRFGRGLRMMGGFNKHLIPRGEAAIRAALQRLKPIVDEGGFIPMPDHRIPPDCSLDDFRRYVDVFKEVFAA